MLQQTDLRIQQIKVSSNIDEHDEEEIQKRLCESECKPDCVFTYYSKENKTENNTDLWELYNTVEINIEHNSMPDIYIKYSPQTTLISVISNFGGLLGMWLGLSFLNILSDFTSILNCIYLKHVFCFLKNKLKLKIINLKPNMTLQVFVERPRASVIRRNTTLPQSIHSRYS